MSTPDENQLIGQQYGKYHLHYQIGQGSYGHVYLAVDTSSGKEVALKIAKAELTAQQEKSFHEEAEKLASLNHPHIIRLLDYNVIDHRPFLVMDYAPASLRNIYNAHQGLWPHELLPYLKEAASGLHYAHERGIVHRDIKPENLLLDHDNRLLVSDFGIAVSIESIDTTARKLSGGTRHYEAPEQLKGKPGKASDQYSLGVVVYEGLMGRLPAFGMRLRFMLSQLFARPPVSISSAVMLTVFRALEKNPQKRYPGVRDFAAAFEQASKQAAPTSPFSRVFTKRSLLLMLLTLLLLVGSALLPLISWPHSSPPEQPGATSVVKPTLDVTVTATAMIELYQQVTTGKPFMSSPLNGQDAASWQSGNSDTAACFFKGGDYHAVSKKVGVYTPCLALTKQVQNFAFQVDLAIATGDYGGLILRDDLVDNIHYRFLIGTNSFYKFGVSTGANALKFGLSSTILNGSNQFNQLTVIAQGSHFFLYINQQPVLEVTDSTSLRAGVVGLAAEADLSPTEVEFRNARLWILP